MSRKPARILIVDDHPLVREALTSRIQQQPDMEVCGEAEDVDDALAQVKATEPDLVIVDLSLKTGHGLDLIKQIRSHDGHIRLLVQSMYDESLFAERALEAGAMGYINKQTAGREVIEAIRQVLAGKPYLSPEMSDRVLRRAILGSGPVSGSAVETLSDRELEVFQLIGNGLTSGKIATQLHLSVHTIDSHREKIKRKLNLNNSAELGRAAVQWVLENG